MTFINNANLVGFWPLNEPSGAMMFHNYAPAFAGKPNAVTYNLHVHVTDGGGSSPDTPHRSSWPGTDQDQSTSGVRFGYRALGSYDAETNNSHEKCLIFGRGGDVARDAIYNASVANEGWTIGFWVHPATSGRAADFEAGGDGYNGNNGLVDLIFQHALLSQSSESTTKEGFWIGVSGEPEGGSQNGHGEFGGPHQLRAYVHTRDSSTFTNNPTTATTEAFVSAPIESGKFTHITVTYEYIGTLSHIVSLYKDGTLVGTDTTNARLTNDSAISDFENSVLTLGGSISANTAQANVIQKVTGWGQIVSGVYAFNSILSAANVEELHGGGGLQPYEGTPPSGTIVDISDDNILGYYPCHSVGYPDASRQHNPLIADSDEGDTSAQYTTVAGPNNAGAIYSAGLGGLAAIAGSGLMQGLADARSFTIAGRFCPRMQVTTDQNLMFSIGGLAGDFNRGLKLSTTTGPSVRLSVYPLNEPSTVVTFTEAEADLWNAVWSHYAVVYDDQTKGIALYLNGALSNSGTLDHSLGNAITNLAGSGYPLTFLGATTSTTPDTFSSVPLRVAGNDFFVAGRPLEPLEISYLATSGVQLGALSGTVHDPRLCGYWPCALVDGDFVAPDHASVWSDIAAPLTRADSSYKWDAFYASAQFQGPFTSDGHDLFGRLNKVDAGISSGVWMVHGGSRGSYSLTNNDGRFSSTGNTAWRFKPVFEDRDQFPQNVLGQYIMGYDLTPSGTIPSVRPDLTADQALEFNSVVSSYGNGGETISTGEGRLRSFLTTFDGLEEGKTRLVFVGQNSSTTIKPLVSGEVTPGLSHDIMFHSWFKNPYSVEAGGAGEVQFDLYVDGTLVDSNTLTAASALAWSDQTPGGSATDDWWLSFGGTSKDRTFTTSVTNDTGLGDIHLRDIFVMHGSFRPEEISALATNGINASKTVTGFSNQPVTTQVTVFDSDLKGYYRFAGGTSGELDRSFNLNNLRVIGDELVRNTVAGDEVGATHQLKYIPGPLAGSDLMVQASGITWLNQSLTGNVAPFATSGTDFDTPNTDFSIGFWFANRNTPGSQYHTLACYGVAPTASNDSGTDDNRSWLVSFDNQNSLKLILSHDGHMRVDNFSIAAADNAGQTTCGVYRVNKVSQLTDGNDFETYKRGNFELPSKDSWAHVAWTYDATAGVVRCFLNGELVDQQRTKGALQLPTDPAARMITFLSPPTAVWQWASTNPRNDDSVMTDFFYFSDALTEAEVRYIAHNGIDNAVGTATSGHIGGFIHGQDTGSGLTGGFTHGLNTGSGHFGGYMPGGQLGSGYLGGFISGVVFGDGTIGGFIQGLDTVSGVMAGYIRGVDVGSGMVAGYIHGQEVGSGFFGGMVLAAEAASGTFGGFMTGADVGSGSIGGFMLGGLQGNFEFDAGFTVEVLASKDFDAQLEIAKTVSSDFDAKVIIFQNEIPPLVDIIIPEVTVSGLMPPFNQYFIGKASGQQGKTIDTTRWTFGDLTPSVAPSESGAGCYPVQHMYAASGFYIAKFEAIDSDGMHNSATRIVHAASGIDPVIVSLSGVPRSGDAGLIVDFSTVVDILPPGVSLSTQLLSFDDGQSTISFNPTHNYTQPGTYKPIWCVRDSRGVIWCDSLEAGNDLLERGGA